ncbi:MAG TPA: hypothetical protein VIL20_21785 [Sandaracinaceae bacterium]
MAARRRSLVPWLVLAALAVGAGAWLLLPRERARVRSPAPQPVASPETAPDAGSDPAPAPPAPRRAEAPPPVSAPPPPACPEDEPDPPGFVRPSVSELLRLRVDELRDRLPQLSRTASPALREGLNGLGGADPEAALRAIESAPDRVQDGFDVAAAARLLVATRALAAGDVRGAERHARALARAHASDPLAHALASLVADRNGDTAARRESMVAAHGLLPDEPALALAAARELALAARFDDAVRAVDDYLDAVPEDARARRWRERMAERAALTRGHARRGTSGVEIAWPQRELSREHVDEVLALLHRAMSDVARLTGGHRRPELAVVVYARSEDMQRATCTPSWTGGVFDGVLHLHAPGLAGDGWERLVRHEATHAQLATIGGVIPHWLNEGLAQWMEGDPSPQAIAAWRRMARDRFFIPFPSLEGRLLDIDDARDAQLAYFQSLAMLLYLVERRGTRGIREAIEQVEAGRHTDLLERLVPDASGETFLAFLARRSA